MLTIIFGAGASYDSDPNRTNMRVGATHRPPLADELFQDRPQFCEALEAFHECKVIVAHLRHLKGQPLEEVLERFADETKSDPRRLSQLMAIRFYIQRVIRHCSEGWLQECRGITNYVTLLEDIRHYGHQRVNLVTFNYDTLLESAIKEVVQKQPKMIDDYLKLEPFMLFKVHGSTNWAQLISRLPTFGADPIRSIINAPDRFPPTHDGFCITARGGESVRDNPSMPVLPAVAVPFRSKSDFVCPAAHMAKLEESLARTRHIVIIGWRGRDAHFVELLRRHAANIRAAQIVAGSVEAAGEIASLLTANGVRMGTVSPLADTFTDYTLSKQCRSFIEAAARAAG